MQCWWLNVSFHHLVPRELIESLIRTLTNDVPPHSTRSVAPQTTESTGSKLECSSFFTEYSVNLMDYLMTVNYSCTELALTALEVDDQRDHDH